MTFIRRIIDEYVYYTRRPWSLNDVGEFWDSVETYDDINKELYPYYQRFINSFTLLNNSIDINNTQFNNILDIQTRTGKGTEFWLKIFKNSIFTCVDFSQNMLLKAQDRLSDNSNVRFNLIKNESFNIHTKYDLILCYETIEHVYDYKNFVKSLTSHLKDGGILILTCPNISWEPIHWITAIIGINHSEGPHRFIRKKILDKLFIDNNLKQLNYNSTIFLPFNNKISIKFDKILTKYIPNSIKELLFLRHSYILQKEVN